MDYKIEHRIGGVSNKNKFKKKSNYKVIKITIEMRLVATMMVMNRI